MWDAVEGHQDPKLCHAAKYKERYRRVRSGKT